MRLTVLLCLVLSARSAPAELLTFRERIPPEVAVDERSREFHVESCPRVMGSMRRLLPAAATLAGYRPAADCARLKPEPRYRVISREATRDPSVIKVLLIGNSLTYYNELPWMLETIANSRRDGKRFVVDSATMSGASLRQLWSIEEPRRKIALDFWDYVILQQWGSPHQREPEKFAPYVRLFAEAAKARGARTLLVQNWPKDTDWKSYGMIRQLVMDVARETGVGIAPVGSAWKAAHDQRRSLVLECCGNHPSLAGSYLAAMVLYATITGRSPIGLPHKLDPPFSRTEVHREPLFTQRLAAEEAEFLQRVAWAAVQRHSS